MGHFLWHAGMVGVTAALVLAARPVRPGRLAPVAVIGAAAYALAYFTDAVEGQTVPLLLPASVTFVALLGAGRIGGARSPIGRFVLLAHALALAMFAIWRMWQGGLPQFSERWGV